VKTGLEYRIRKQDMKKTYGPRKDLHTGSMEGAALHANLL